MLCKCVCVCTILLALKRYHNNFDYDLLKKNILLKFYTRQVLCSEV